MIQIEQHDGIYVLRDDLLPGGTKSVLLDEILPKEFDEFVYATPVYGGFQIALAMWCKKNGKRCVLFCAKRKEMHPNTLKAKAEGATISEVEHGYLSVVEKRAKEYMALVGDLNAYKIPWGSHNEQSIDLIANRATKVITQMGQMYSVYPDVIFITLGSGMLTEGILEGSREFELSGQEPPVEISQMGVHAVQVGAQYEGSHPRLTLYKYHKPFDKKADVIPPFPSMPNYDAKGWHYAKNYQFLNPEKKVLFWNVL